MPPAPPVEYVTRREYLRSWRIAGVLLAVVVGLLLYALPGAIRFDTTSREIAFLGELDTAVRTYHRGHGFWPASALEPEPQSQIDVRAVALIRRGRLAYYVPAADSPPTFILIRLTTPEGNYAKLVNGTFVYPPSK